MLYKREFLTAFNVSIPVMMGYEFLGFTFGLLMVSKGYPWYLSVLMSLVIYAGSLQFIAVEFFSAKLGMIDIFISSIFINIRQVFYGFSLLKKFKKVGWLKPYLIFTLTDETYALLTSVHEDARLKKKYYYFYLSALNHFYWVSGTLIGTLFGSIVHFDTKGLDFSLTALFVVLAVEQYKNRRKILPFIIGFAASTLSLFTVPIDRMIITSISMALLGMFLLRARLER